MTPNLQEWIDNGGTIIGVDVDTQKDFADEDGALSVYGFTPAHVRPNIQKLNQVLTHQTGSVDAHAYDAAEFEASGGPHAAHCVKGTEGQLKIPESRSEKTRFVPISKGKVQIGESQFNEGNRNYGPREFSREVREGVQVIFEKEIYSLFQNPNARPFIKQLVKDLGGREKVLFLVYGYCTGKYCVDAAAEGLAQLGYHTAIATDASAPLDIDHDGQPQNGTEVTRQLAQANDIRLVTTAEVTEVLQAS